MRFLAYYRLRWLKGISKTVSNHFLCSKLLPTMTPMMLLVLPTPTIPFVPLFVLLLPATPPWLPFSRNQYGFANVFITFTAVPVLRLVLDMGLEEYESAKNVQLCGIEQVIASVESVYQDEVRCARLALGWNINKESVASLVSASFKLLGVIVLINSKLINQQVVEHNSSRKNEYTRRTILLSSLILVQLNGVVGSGADRSLHREALNRKLAMCGYNMD